MSEPARPRGHQAAGVMTADAVRLRNNRHTFALPCGGHDRLIRALNKALPAAIGGIVAIMLLAPLVPRGEVSFLLDRRKVAVTTARIDVDHATYRGTDNLDRPFEVTAGRAVQASPEIPVVALDNLAARLQLADGPARVTAPTGSYDFDKARVSSRQPLQFTAADGYRMTMNNIDVDLSTKTATGDGGVSGSTPTGVFRADRAQADLAARTVALEGNARLRMVPGRKMSFPR